MTIAIPIPAIRDSHLKWSRNFQIAPSFNIAGYQAKINRIAGLTQAGEPVLRLVWGGNESVFVIEGSEWVETPRYAFLSRQSHNFGAKIPIRRWLIEENTDPGQVEAMGGKNHGRLKVKEAGFYESWLMIADHSHCPPNCKDKKACYGDYKAPDERELKYIAECTFDLMKDKHRPDPRKMIVPEMTAPYLSKELDEKEQEEKNEQENVSYVKDWMRTHGVGRTQNTKPS